MGEYESTIPSTKRFRHEILSSLNLGLAFWYALFAYVADSYSPSYAPKFLQNTLVSFEKFLLGIAPLVVSVPRRVHFRSVLIWEVGFVLIVAATGFLIFALRRSLAGTWLEKCLFEPIAGIMALGAVPGCWFLIIEFTRPGPEMRQHFWSSIGLLFVVEMAIAISLMFLVKKGPIWLGSLVLIAHYIFWVYIIGRPSGPPNLSSALISPIFPLAGFSWLQYSRRSHQDSENG